MLVHGLHHALHQRFVVALHLFLLYLILLLLGARELALQAEHIAYQTVDDHVQLMDIERFGHKGIGTSFQAFQTVGYIGFRREHDHGYMINDRILLDHTQQRETVHLGHHHIANHQIVRRIEQRLHSITPIIAGVHMIILGQFAHNETA